MNMSSLRSPKKQQQKTINSFFKKFKKSVSEEAEVFKTVRDPGAGKEKTDELFENTSSEERSFQMNCKSQDDDSPDDVSQPKQEGKRLKPRGNVR